MSLIKRLKPYFSTALMCAREQGYFGIVNTAAIYIQRLLGLAALMLIWVTLFSQGADTGGLTLEQMLSYTWVSHLLAPMLDVRTPASSWMHEGTLQSQFQRPMGIFGQLTAHTIGGWLLPFCFFTLPLMIITPLMGLPLIPASWWFLPSLILGISLGFAVDYLFACLLMRLKNLSWTVHSIRNAMNWLLNGSFIPFAMLSFGIGDFLCWTPFAAMAGAPLAVFTGVEAPFPLLFIQLFWNLLLWPLAVWGLRQSRERMVAYGG